MIRCDDRLNPSNTPATSSAGCGRARHHLLDGPCPYVWNNAATESFFSSLKTERTERRTYRTQDEAKADVFDYIECFYNPRRRHSTIGYLSPVSHQPAAAQHWQPAAPVPKRPRGPPPSAYDAASAHRVGVATPMSPRRCSETEHWIARGWSVRLTGLWSDLQIEHRTRQSAAMPNRSMERCTVGRQKSSTDGMRPCGNDITHELPRSLRASVRMRQSDTKSVPFRELPRLSVSP